MSDIQKFKPEEWPSNRKLNQKQPRRMPTSTEEDEMNRGLVALGNLLKDSGIWWQLDGALIISAMLGRYIGVHADIDVSFRRDELPRLEQHLAVHGYGMFRYYRDRDDDGVVRERILQRVGAGEFHRLIENDRWWQLRIAAINANGKIRIDADHPILDISVIEEVPEGLCIEWQGIVLPKRWHNGTTVEFRGVRLNLSCPARFIFFKSFFDRVYDENDLKQFVELGTVTLQDLDEVEMVLERLAQQPDMDSPTLTRAQECVRRIRSWLEHSSSR